MTILNVKAGETASGLTMNSGDIIGLSTGGASIDITVNNGGNEDVNFGSIATRTVVNGGGTMHVNSSGTTLSTTVNSGGIEDLFGGGTATGTTVNSGGVQRIRTVAHAIGTVVSSGGIQVVGAGPTNMASGTVLLDGGAVDLAAFSFAAGGSVTLDPLTDLLTVSEGGNSYPLQLSGDYTSEAFVLTADSGGTGTLVTAQSTGQNQECFCRGTLILTDRGEIPVEALREGDQVQVLTQAGMIARPVKWIGHRQVDCAHHPKPDRVWPVRIRADAFDADCPRRDLWLSPDHAVYVDEMLIPVKYLINGTSIAQVPVDRVMYYHVELPEHSILLAEGLPSESFLLTTDRANFDNADGAIRLFPDFSPPPHSIAAAWDTFGCARLVVTGPELDTTRQRLHRNSLSRKAGEGWGGGASAS